MKPFSLLIKPSSADCNLRCAYCFYLDRRQLYPQTRTHRMSDRVLDRMIASFMGKPQPQYSFGWQGGEPTLMGLAFFREALRLQREAATPGMRIANAIQTNGMALTPAWCRFFKENNFLVGLSPVSYTHLRAHET